MEKFVQELSWREYWQQVWRSKKQQIFSDLKQEQGHIAHCGVPNAMLDASTKINAIDKGLELLYRTGYMHNHMRMYVASLCCNVAGAHWLTPAKWMFAQLLDGDLGSNHLSWQWVAGTFSNKKYYANQDNINHFFNSKQANTYLDKSYEALIKAPIPTELCTYSSFKLKTQLPELPLPVLKTEGTTCIYNYYNLDPYWHSDKPYQRVLLLEPSLFDKYPVADKNITFILKLAQNIPDIKIFVGEFTALQKHLGNSKILYKEHSLNTHYQGLEEPREWLSTVSGFYPSFFAFWKQCKKEWQQ